MLGMDYYLSKGKHETAEEGRCAMEFVSYLAGEEHSDHPMCVDPLLGHIMRGVNDWLLDKDRQKLRPLLARCIGTFEDGHYDERWAKARAFNIKMPGSSLNSSDPEHVKAYLKFLETLLPTELVEIPNPEWVNFHEPVVV